MSNSYFLIGHSFGGVLALELAKRLEKLNIKGHVVLLDSSPCYIKASVDAEIIGLDLMYSKILDDPLKMVVVSSITKMISATNNKKLEQQISGCVSWEECIDKMINFLDQSIYSHYYLEHIVNAIYCRLHDEEHEY